VNLLGFIIRKFDTIHGHMNVKFAIHIWAFSNEINRATRVPSLSFQKYKTRPHVRYTSVMRTIKLPLKLTNGHRLASYNLGQILTIYWIWNCCYVVHFTSESDFYHAVSKGTWFLCPLFLLHVRSILSSLQPISEQQITVPTVNGHVLYLNFQHLH
jgi:hypothetical protein